VSRYNAFAHVFYLQSVRFCSIALSSLSTRHVFMPPISHLGMSSSVSACSYATVSMSVRNISLPCLHSHANERSLRFWPYHLLYLGSRHLMCLSSWLLCCSVTFPYTAIHLRGLSTLTRVSFSGSYSLSSVHPTLINNSWALLAVGLAAGVILRHDLGRMI